MIEDRCTLFKLAGIPEEEVKRKLLYLSLKDGARDWFRSMDLKYRLDWEYMKKAFYLKYYSPLELMVTGVIFIIFGLTQERVSLKLGGG